MERPVGRRAAEPDQRLGANNLFTPAGANTPPTISPFGNRTIAEDGTTGQLPFTVADAETPVASLTVSGGSSNPTLVPLTNIIFGVSATNATNRTITVLPARNQSGSATITVTVTDGGALTASRQFLLTVVPINDLPTITSVANQTILMNDSTPLLGVTVEDVETPAGSLTLSASSSNLALVPNANILLAGTGSNRTVQVVPQAGATGMTMIIVLVRDAQSAQGSTTFQVTVLPVDPPVIVVPPQSQRVTVGAEVTFSVTAIGMALRYQWHLFGSNLPLATNAVLVIPKARPWDAGEYSVLVTNNGGGVFSPAATLTVALVARGGEWNYWDLGGDLGTGWRMPDYDDSGWLSGEAELGYGDGDETTVLRFGPDANNKHVTSYFRRAFAAQDAHLYTNLVMRLRRDDGAAIYLNGIEVVRSNLPPGEIRFDTLASGPADGAGEVTFFESQVDPVWLREGTNVLAVEVHQVSGNSEDLSFDLELVGGSGDLPVIRRQPASQTVPPNTPNVTFSIETAGAGPLTYQWQLNGMNIPDATNATYLIPVALVERGGAYRVIVIGSNGAVASETALLTIGVPLVGVSDSFAGATVLAGTSGSLRGTSAGATKETGEPDHGGKPGGRSVWFMWQAPAVGVATFSTRGSSFDTLLGVYVGNTVGNLTTLAGDEDNGGFYGSTVQFNTELNAFYRIAVDGVGFGGSGGPFALGWAFEQTPDSIPLILSQPASQGAVQGSDATFTVTATNNPPNGVAYQWFVDGLPMDGATGPSLALNNVLPADVGYYTVRLSNTQGRVVFSQPATLAVGSAPGLNVLDKLEDFFPTAGGGGGGGAWAERPPFTPAGTAPTASGAISIRRGQQYHQYAPVGRNSGSDLLPCSSYFNGTLWLAVTSIDHSVIEIDTADSRGKNGVEVFTKLAVYTVAAGFETSGSRYLLACDNRSAGLGKPSRLFIEAEAGKIYGVVAAPVGCSTNDPCYPPTLRLNVHSWPAVQFVASSGALELSTGPRGSIARPEYHWLRNGEPLLVSPTNRLLLTNVVCASAGTYELVVSNTANATIAEVVPFAMVFVDEKSHVYAEWMPLPTGAEVRVTAFGTHPFRLERAAGLPEGGWVAVATNVNPRLPLVFVERDSRPTGHHLYRSSSLTGQLPGPPRPSCPAPRFWR